MGRTKKSHAAWRANLPSKISNNAATSTESQKTTCEECRDSGDESTWTDEDYTPSETDCDKSDDDWERWDEDEVGSEEMLEVQNDVDLLTFKTKLQEAHDAAVDRERKKRQSTKRPLHYTGNSARTKRRNVKKGHDLQSQGFRSVADFFRPNQEENRSEVSGPVSAFSAEPVSESSWEQLSNSESDMPTLAEPAEANCNSNPNEENCLAEVGKGECLETTSPDAFIPPRQPALSLAPETRHNLVIERELDHRDLPALRRANAFFTVKAMDKTLDLFFRARLTAMRALINFFVDPMLDYNWKESSLLASKAVGRGPKHARNLHHWVIQYIRHDTLPLNKYGQL